MRRLFFGSVIVALTVSTPALALTQTSPEISYPNVTREQVGLSSRTAATSRDSDYALYGGRSNSTAAERAQRSIRAAIERADLSQALSELRLLAAKGDNWANRQLGWMYISGLGVAPDASLAVHYFQAAARQGDPPSALALGMAFRRGYGVDVDPAQADYWLTRARRSGNWIVRRDARRLQRGG